MYQSFYNIKLKLKYSSFNFFKCVLCVQQKTNICLVVPLLLYMDDYVVIVFMGILLVFFLLFICVSLCHNTGSPGSPTDMSITKTSSALNIHWSEGDFGAAPVTGYVIEARPSGTFIHKCHRQVSHNLLDTHPFIRYTNYFH